MARTLSGKNFGSHLTRSFAAQKLSAGFTSDVWVSRFFVERLNLKTRANATPFVGNDTDYFNLEQFEDLDEVSRKSRAFFGRRELRFASSGIFIHSRSVALSRELLAASVNLNFQSCYWDTAASFSNNFGVSVLPSAHHTCGYFNAEQTNTPEIFTDENCVPFVPKLIGSVHSNVAPSLRRHTLSRSSEERKSLVNAWGTENGFKILNIPLKRDAVGVQVLDEQGCASHWFNVSDSTDPQSALAKMNSVGL